MKDEIGVTDVLNEKVGQMDAEVERMNKVLQAKEAVLENVICTINQLPKHPLDTILIRVKIFFCMIYIYIYPFIMTQINYKIINNIQH